MLARDGKRNDSASLARSAREKILPCDHCAGAHEWSNDDYCLASSIYSPTAFAIIGELPLVNCSRYAVHQGPRIKTSLLPGHGSARAAVFAVLLVINFAPVAYYRRRAALMRGPDVRVALREIEKAAPRNDYALGNGSSGEGTGR